MSLRLVEQLPIKHEDAIVDIGAGESTLIDALLARGHHDLTALDAALHALDRARSRLITAGQTTGAATVTWEVADILTWRPKRRCRLWHDRAVFHFLTAPADRATYRDLAASTVTPGGFLIVATFALDGPTHCSGLPVARYGSAELAAAFAPHFTAHLADESCRLRAGTRSGGGVATVVVPGSGHRSGQFRRGVVLLVRPSSIR
jgi:trans-aconitate methyltransferase